MGAARRSGIHRMARKIRPQAAQFATSSGIEVGPSHVLGEYSCGLPGPLTLVSGGMHGNEPAGVLALRQVLAQLADRQTVLRGRMVGLAGNVAALQAGVRYIDRDLNRQWDARSIRRLLHDGPGDCAEDWETLELLSTFDALTTGHFGQVNLLDLHTMSAKGVPFIVACDSPHSRELAEILLLPGIAGLEKAIPGTTLEHFLGQGFRAVAVEGGQNGDPQAVVLCEALIWLLLVGTGMVDAADVPDLAGKRAFVAAQAEGMPQHVKVCYRHGVRPDDEFEMLPGYQNLQPVQAGQLLARDRCGDVVAPRDGWILLPLYQKSGNDGFFIGTAN